MLKIAITGNIASGKSEMQKILEEKGYKVLDTDKVGHEILKTSQELKTLFSSYDVFDTKGNILREKLGTLVFSNLELKSELEGISHPLIKNRIINFFNENKSEKVCFVAIPLLFEANMQDMFDKIILVYADDNIRINRLMKRNSYSKETAQIRINSQQSQEEKKNHCDYVIFNNLTVKELACSVNKLVNNLFQ